MRQPFMGASMLVRIIPSTLVAATLVAAIFLAAPVFAQTKAPAPKAPAVQVPIPAAPVQSVPSPAKAPDPTFDEGTAQRIAAALLSYSALEVRGGWPTVPASPKLSPGGSGPEVAVLRQRLA